MFALFVSRSILSEKLLLRIIGATIRLRHRDEAELLLLHTGHGGTVLLWQAGLGSQTSARLPGKLGRVVHTVGWQYGGLERARLII